jgi:catechol 2,3-dioxygenase-like lactoylglutathione lyase family enzyme
MSDEWYSRSVLFVSDIDTSVEFYVKQFGFKQNWRWEDDGGKP